MASCKCGATVSYVQVDGEIMPLESFEAVSGERYLIVDYARTPWRAVSVDQNSPEAGFLDHRTRCPYQPTR